MRGHRHGLSCCPTSHLTNLQDSFQPCRRRKGGGGCACALVVYGVLDGSVLPPRTLVPHSGCCLSRDCPGLVSHPCEIEPFSGPLCVIPCDIYSSCSRQVLLLELGSPAEFLDRAVEPPPPKMLRAALRNLYDLQVRQWCSALLGQRDWSLGSLRTVPFLTCSSCRVCERQKTKQVQHGT